MTVTVKAAEKPAEKQKKPWDDTIRTLIFALVLAIFFRSFAYEPFHIPSGSMKDTLLIGDYLFVSKYAYGYSRYSFPFGLPLFEGRILDSRPKRGDVVVFRQPSNPRIDFIKRLVGLPGDQVQVKEGILYINDQALERAPDGHYIEDDNRPVLKSIPAFRETLPEGKVIRILKEHVHGPVDNTAVFVVPEGHYFMMGDNRDNSRDSRYLNEVGFIPEENLIGRAEIIFFSTDGSAMFRDPFSWFSAMRFERFFKRID